MNEISTNYKASKKLSSWIRRQLQEVAKYVPRKGGICKLCGLFCRTYKTDSETGVRYHRCPDCGINFKTSENPEARESMSVLPDKQKNAVGKIPTKQDAEPVKRLKVDSRKKRKGK